MRSGQGWRPRSCAATCASSWGGTRTSRWRRWLPLDIAVAVTLLLLTTLFRLGLEVSATRLILLKANAGEVIDAFGNFVVAGNLVVGAVIFVIVPRLSIGLFDCKS